MKKTKNAFLLLVLFVADLERRSVCGSKFNRFTNGTRALPEEAPFIAIIKIDRFPFCGGIIWNHYIILTAAHCLTRYAVDQLRVYVGSTVPDYTEFDLMFRVNEIRVHPKFQHDTHQYDMGIIVLERKIHLNASKLLSCVPRPVNYAALNVTDCFVYSWGRNPEENDTTEDQLYKLKVNIEPDHICQSFPGNYHSHYNLCASGRPYKQIGNNHYGGPLICSVIDDPMRLTLAGIVSQDGIFKTKESEIIIYVKISNFRPWLALMENEFL